MKKTIVLIIAMFIGIVLCACGAATETTGGLEKIDKNGHSRYVGVWESGGHNYEKAIPVTMELMENGKVLLHYVSTYDITQAPWAVSGDWSVDGNRILAFLYRGWLHTSKYILYRRSQYN